MTDIDTLTGQAQLIAAPIPFSRDQLHVSGTEVEWMELIGRLHTDQMLFAGLIPEQAARYLRARNIRFLDYMHSEEVAQRNAVATAEGAIAEAIRLWPGNLAGSSCLVLGYGTCARPLAQRLRLLGAAVCVYARRAEVLAAAETDGMQPVKRRDLCAALEHCSMVFNTIPAPLLTAEEVHRIPAGHLLLELASGAGCIGAPQPKLQFQYVRCPGLPGKYAPRASAEILYRYIMQSVESSAQSHQVQGTGPAPQQERKGDHVIKV